MHIGSVIMMLTLLAAPGAALANDDLPLARTPSDMSGAEIDVHNEGLALADPNFIKCRRIDEPGSLVKKLRVCNTNAQWKRIGDRGNQDARDLVDTLARGWTNGQEPKDQLVTVPARPQ